MAEAGSARSPASGRADARRRLMAAYLLAQGLLVVGWWLLLYASSSVRARFELDADRMPVLDAFVLADLAVVAGGSIVAAWAVRDRRPWAARLVAFTAGGVAYATLYLVVWALIERTGAVGLVPMVAASAATGFIAVAEPAAP